MTRKGDTFTQYPLDYTKDIFRPLLDRAESSAKIAIHHRGNLFYFLYYFSLDSTSDIFGMCLMADCLFDDYAALFNVFDSILSELLNQGIVLHYSERGERSFSDIELHSFKNELDKCSLLLVASAGTSLVESDYLPVDDFSYSKYDVKEMCLSDGPSLINKELGKYSTVILTRTSGGLERNDRVAALLRSQSDRISELEQEVSRSTNNPDNKQLQNAVSNKNKFIHFLLFLLIIGLCIFRFSVLNLKNEVDSLKVEIDKQDSKIKEITHFTFSTGATIGKSNDGGFDNGWIMWLHAKQKLQMTSFNIKGGGTSGKIRKITLAVYDSDDNLIATVNTYVQSEQVTRVNLNDDWTLDSGYYYLRIKNSNGCSLHYHSSNDTEYSQFSGGALEVTGCCSYDSRKNADNKQNHSYYQYFYNIQYRLLIKNNDKSNVKSNVKSKKNGSSKVSHTCLVDSLLVE